MRFDGAPAEGLGRLDERERLWSSRKAERPAFADYEGRTRRQIPVVILERVG